MNVNKKIILIIILFSFTAQFSKAQQKEPTLEEILAKTETQTKRYSETFKNLVAEENKIVRRYEKGKIDKEQIVKSNLIIYDASGGQQTTSTEYRNILSIDGKPIKNSEKRVEKIFREANKAKSVEKELEILKKESYRYDKTFRLDGFVFLKAVIIKEQFFPNFEYRLEVMENLDGREVYVVSYQQTKTSENLTYNIKIDQKFADKLDLAYENNEPFVRYKGKVWIDKNTFQVWREERKFCMPRNDGKDDFEFIKSVFSYQPSKFGILVPKKIVYESFNPKLVSLKVSFVKNLELILEYSNFWKPESEVKSADLK